MPFNLDALFTHVDVLKCHEPTDSAETNIEPDSSQNQKEPNSSTSQVSNSEDMPAAALPAAYFHCPKAHHYIQKADFISLLKIGWNKNYNEDLSFKTLYDPKDGIGELEEQLLAGPWTETARGRTKKMAQHRAAAKVLLKIVDSGRHKEFLVPGENAEEAYQIINIAMQQLEHPTTTTIQADSSNNDAGGSSSNSIFSASPSPITQQNWVGKVQELVMKRRLKSRWNDVYTQIGSANTIEHSCLLNFDILDASGQTTIHHLEGNGQARGKKMAKQLAFKQVFDQLQQLYGTVLTMPSTAAVEKPTAALGDQNMQTHEPMDTSSTPIAVDPVGPNAGNNHNKLTMEEGERVETDELDAEEDEKKPDLQDLLYKILNGNRPGTEKMFRYILDLKDAQVERLFPRAELKFVESTKTEDYVQVYLEVWVNADGKQRSLPCTHGGAGATMEAARDDACLQAMSYLYIFGGFSPSESAEEKK